MTKETKTIINEYNDEGKLIKSTETTITETYGDVGYPYPYPTLEYPNYPYTPIIYGTQKIDSNSFIKACSNMTDSVVEACKIK